jgi:hypothetical protein
MVRLYAVVVRLLEKSKAPEDKSSGDGVFPKYLFPTAE